MAYYEVKGEAHNAAERLIEKNPDIFNDIHHFISEKCGEEKVPKVTSLTVEAYHDALNSYTEELYP